MAISITITVESYEELEALAVKLGNKTCEASDVVEINAGLKEEEPPSFGPSIFDGLDSEGMKTVMKEQDLDVNLVPWDERIHASTKTKNSDGSWKRKKGVKKEEYDRIVRELQAQTRVPVPPAPPAAPVHPAAPMPPVPPAPPGEITFGVLMQKISDAVNAGQLTHEMVNALVQSQGIASLPLLHNNPSAVAATYAMLFPNG